MHRSGSLCGHAPRKTPFRILQHRRSTPALILPLRHFYSPHRLSEAPADMKLLQSALQQPHLQQPCCSNSTAATVEQQQNCSSSSAAATRNSNSAAATVQHLTLCPQHSALGPQHSALRPQHSALNTRPSTLGLNTRPPGLNMLLTPEATIPSSPAATNFPLINQHS